MEHRGSVPGAHAETETADFLVPESSPSDLGDRIVECRVGSPGHLLRLPVPQTVPTGASRLLEVLYGIVPQVMPLWLSYSLYRFESNVRGATVLGIVGAGGIGQVLFENIRGFYYAETAALMIMVIATVAIVDIISQQLRKVMV